MTGKAMARDRRQPASQRGWSASTPPRSIGVAFALSAAIGAIGGMLVTPITLTSYDLGTLLALKGFAAAMLGGMGASRLGAVVGGLCWSGCSRALGAGYMFVRLQGRCRLPRSSSVMLFVMPQGLLGASQHRPRLTMPSLPKRISR
jgi:branched-chain amino acid transport system permease protein